MSELLLLSGGIDSIALAAWKRPSLCLTIDYGQAAAKAEIQASAQVCIELGLKHLVLDAAIAGIGSGIMAGHSRSPHSAHSEFWPFRNQYLVTIASMVALQRSCRTVLIGTVVTDQRHKDGSPEFLHHLREAISMQEGGVRLEAPAAELTSEELVRRSKVVPSVLAWSHSCHVSCIACGDCPGCNKHSSVMRDIGLSHGLQ